MIKINTKFGIVWTVLPKQQLYPPNLNSCTHLIWTFVPTKSEHICMVDTGRHDISALSPSCSNLSSSSLNTLNTSISSLSSSNYLLPITSSHNQKLLGTLSSPTDHCLLISTSLTEQSHLNIDVSLPNSLTSRSSFSLDETIEEDSTFYQCQAR